MLSTKCKINNNQINKLTMNHYNNYNKLNNENTPSPHPFKKTEINNQFGMPNI